MKLIELIGIISDQQYVSLRDVDYANTQIWFGLFDDVPRVYHDYYVDLICASGKTIKINIYN